MKIGEFAKMTGMPISVLRHYDKEGLLCPDYVDHFSGYRYYSAGQIGQVHKIELLKSGGLSLKEIRDILKNADDHEFIKGILEHRESEYRDMLAAVAEVKRMMFEKEEKNAKAEKEKLSAVEKNELGEMIIKGISLSSPLNQKAFLAACRSLDEEIQRRNFQRISGFLTYGGKDKNEIQVAAKVVKLRDEMGELHEDINLVFEDDEQVIGKWKVVGEYAVKEDFYSEAGERRESDMGNKDREIYFLPDGEDYWIYSWTKGYLKLDGGDQSWLCRYQIEDDQGSRYMFVENKSYEYLRGGMPTVLVLEQVDKKRYNRREIAREDDTDYMIMEWKSGDYRWGGYDTDYYVFIRDKV